MNDEYLMNPLWVKIFASLNKNKSSLFDSVKIVVLQKSGVTLSNFTNNKNVAAFFFNLYVHLWRELDRRWLRSCCLYIPPPTDAACPDLLNSSTGFF